MESNVQRLERERNVRGRVLIGDTVCAGVLPLCMEERGSQHTEHSAGMETPSLAVTSTQIT